MNSRKKKRMSRNFGEGTVMVRAGISTTGRIHICFISTKMNNEKYIELLDDVVINFGIDSLGNNWMFQQNNTIIYKSKATKSFLSSRNIRVLDYRHVVQI